MGTPFLYVATILIWGTTWIAITYQLGSAAPNDLGDAPVRARERAPFRLVPTVPDSAQADGAAPLRGWVVASQEAFFFMNVRR